MSKFAQQKERINQQDQNKENEQQNKDEQENYYPFVITPKARKSGNSNKAKSKQFKIQNGLIFSSSQNIFKPNSIPKIQISGIAQNNLNMLQKQREDNQEKWKDCLRKLEYKGAH